MSALDTYTQFKERIKTAASNERPHTMLPGRTTVSKRGVQGTVAPDIEEEEVQVKPPEAPKAPKVPRAPRAPRAPKAPSTPKVDINFSVKLGSQGNTGTQVDGSFHPDTRVGGSYGITTPPGQESLMRTPAVPGADVDPSGYVSEVKTSAIVDRILKKIAEAQPPLPLPDPEPEPDQSDLSDEEELQALLRRMKDQNPEFYAKQTAYREEK